MREFSRSLPMSLMRAREAVMREFRLMLNEHDLTEQQWRVLHALAAQTGGLEIGLLAQETLLLGPSLSRIVTNLTNRGLVAKVPDATDGRKTVVKMTGEGRRLFGQVAPQSEARYKTIENNFGAAKLAQLQDLLEDLTQSCSMGSNH